MSFKCIFCVYNFDLLFTQSKFEFKCHNQNLSCKIYTNLMRCLTELPVIIYNNIWCNFFVFRSINPNYWMSFVIQERTKVPSGNSYNGDMRLLNLKNVKLFRSGSSSIIHVVQCTHYTYIRTYMQYIHICRDEDPVSGYGSGALCLTCERYSKYHWISFLDNLQVFFFVFLIFCVRRSIDVLDPENQPGSGSEIGSRALRLTENVWHQKYENKKEDLHSIVF